MTDDPKRRYTDADRALALEVVARHGGEVTRNVINETRVLLGAPSLPKVTIWRWLRDDVTERKKATPEAKEQARLALDEMMERAARKYTEHALKDEVVNKATAAQAMTAAAIAVDKMRLLRDMPTEIVHGVLEFLDVARRRNLDPMAIMRNLVNEMATVGDEGDRAES